MTDMSCGTLPVIQVTREASAVPGSAVAPETVVAWTPGFERDLGRSPTSLSFTSTMSANSL